MSCIIFGYRRFYAIICKITHFFYPKRKFPPLFAHSTLHKAKSVPCTTLPTCAASASPPAAETMTGGEHFRHPGGGGSRAKPRISPRGVVATCGACQIAPVHNRTPEVVRGCAPAVVLRVSLCVSTV